MDYLDVSNPERVTFPRFEDIQEDYPKELGSYIQFPQFNLRTQSNKGRNVGGSAFLFTPTVRNV